MRRFEVLASIICAAALAAACKDAARERERRDQRRRPATRRGRAEAEADAGRRRRGQAAMALEEQADGARAEGGCGQGRLERPRRRSGSRPWTRRGRPASWARGARQAQGRAAARTPEGPTRAWFPETFLFEPLVVTDDTGAATVPVRVPDRLTTGACSRSRHSRIGAQGGAVDELPRHAAGVRRSGACPPFLIVGDEIRLPIQIVNTTASRSRAR